MLEKGGARRLDADEEARRALESQSLKPQLRALFGADAIPDHGPVDRERVAARVFADAQIRQALEALIHPEVRAAFHRARAELSPGQILAYDVPLLYEAHLADDFDLVIVVSAPREVRAQRALKRNGWTDAEFAARERAQVPLEEKEKMADLVIQNNGSEGILGNLAVELLERIRHAYPGRRNS